jgi:hypothetical protein
MSVGEELCGMNRVRVIPIFIVFSLILGSLSSKVSGQITKDSETRIFSEAPVFFEDGVRMSNAISVKFRKRVIDLPLGEKQAGSKDIRPIFSNVRAFFDSLETEHNTVNLYKQVPKAVWGDTIRVNTKTGHITKLHDLSQLFTIQFTDFVPIDFIMYKLEQLPEVEFTHQPIQAIFCSGPDDYDDYYGWGRINAYEALRYTLENYGGSLQGEVVITEDLTIPSGKTLAIEAGTTIKFDPGVQLIINGTLDVNGTSSNKVTFTRSGTSGSWDGIKLNSSSIGDINHAIIRYSVRGVEANSTTFSMHNSEIKNCTYGIYASGSAIYDVTYNLLRYR